jgi:hypothetical protein
MGDGRRTSDEGSYFVLLEHDMLGDNIHERPAAGRYSWSLARATELAASGSSREMPCSNCSITHDPVFARIRLRLSPTQESDKLRIQTIARSICRDRRMRIYWQRDPAYFLRGAWTYADAATRSEFVSELADFDREQVAKSSHPLAAFLQATKISMTCPTGAETFATALRAVECQRN